MFHLMKNLVNYLQKSGEKRITIVVIGVDNAGKTTLISSIKGEVPMDLGPTWGFQDETHKMGKYHLTFYDVGGGDSIRGIWASYFAEVSQLHCDRKQHRLLYGYVQAYLGFDTLCSQYPLVVCLRFLAFFS
eukprot:TRINITY_DN7310_c0_g1_i2.p1 TRINITY_DN7310_c0_g1~~TRINITY_DN7310_c0_g1_i2.p1  ORF type:complete len:131 (+),score=10.29 TRINITY_DN7310_c0_g1_i2:256-648(+)